MPLPRLIPACRVRQSSRPSATNSVSNSNPPAAPSTSSSSTTPNDQPQTELAAILSSAWTAVGFKSFPRTSAAHGEVEQVSKLVPGQTLEMYIRLYPVQSQSHPSSS